MNVKNLAILGQQIGRSTTAVIDMMTQRGAIKGEELSTIGNLRDQCSQLVQLSEQVLEADVDADPAES